MIEAVPQGTKRRKAAFAVSAGKYSDSYDELVTDIDIKNLDDASAYLTKFNRLLKK